MIFLDTNVVVDVLRRFPPAVAYLETAEQQGTLSLSIPSQMELIIGCRNRAEVRRLREFLGRFEIRSLSATIGGTAVDLIYQYRLSHGLLLADALIAATALEYEETLYTKNVRHFRMILLKAVHSGRFLLLAFPTLPRLSSWINLGALRRI